MLEKPPPETKSEDAVSPSLIFLPAICVAPTEVMYGQVAGNLGIFVVRIS